MKTETWTWALRCHDCKHHWDTPYFQLCPECGRGRVVVISTTMKAGKVLESTDTE
jgi:rRNA maturation endonuclease Nob1